MKEKNIILWTSGDIEDMLKGDSEFMSGRQAMPKDFDIKALVAVLVDDDTLHESIAEELYYHVDTALDTMIDQQGAEPIDPPGPLQSIKPQKKGGKR